jgi:AMIN domain
MTYARKLALLLFILWAGLVISVVLITLQRTHRNLTDLQGHRILQRLLQLPQQLLSPQRARLTPRQETLILSQNPGTIPPKTSQLPVTASVTPQRASTVLILKQMTAHQQGADWCYQLETTGEITNYRQFTLTAPTRWVLDLPGRWQIQETKAQHFSKGPVQSIVVGYHLQHLRVVFWIKKGVSMPAITTEAGQLVIKFGVWPATPQQGTGT